jgi:hypothetical protein
MAPQQELRLVMEGLTANHGGIVLFHDTKRQTAVMLPAFMRSLKASGYPLFMSLQMMEKDHKVTTPCPRKIKLTGWLLKPNGFRVIECP